MYKIYADDLLIYDDTNSDTHLKVLSPQLSLEDNCAGSLKMTIPPGNVGYDVIQRMMTEIRVTKDDNEIWSGRVLQESKDFWNQRNLVCEGELAYLNDTSQPQELHKYDSSNSTNPIADALTTVLGVHNSHVDNSKKFVVRYVSSMDKFTTETSVELITNYEKTIECINEKFLKIYGGRLILQKQNGIRYLDYYADSDPIILSTNTQEIEFGRNLLDFTKSFDSAEYATVIVPLGKRLEEQKIEGIESYLTVEDADDGDGSIYVKNQTAINERGWIEKVVHWDNEGKPNNLYGKAQRYLSDLQFDTMVIELSAFDLHYLSPEIEEVKVGDRIHVVSKPHGVDRYFIVKKLEIPLDQPQNTKFQLGDSVKTNLATSLTAVNNKINAEIKAQLEKAPVINSDKILSEAQEYTDALMSQNMNGYVTTLSNENGTSELLVSESKPVKKNQDNTYTVQRLWRFDMHGLGYSDDYGATWKTAITMDGTIIGERIAAGSIHGSKITAGSLGLVSEAEAEKCTLKLEVIGIPGDALDIGTISTTDGTNAEGSGKTVRTRGKYYFTRTKIITVNDYWFNLYRYTDNTTAESGYAQSYGSYTAGQKVEIPTDGYYRIVAYVGRTVTSQDLPEIASSFDFGESTVVSSADIRINGMVTFTNLADPTSEDGSGSVTYIDGGHIKTDTLTVKDIYNDDTKIITSYLSDESDEESIAEIIIGNDHWDHGRDITEISMICDFVKIGRPTSHQYDLYIDPYNTAIYSAYSADSYIGRGWDLGKDGDPGHSYFRRVHTRSLQFMSGCYLYYDRQNDELILVSGGRQRSFAFD